MSTITKERLEWLANISGRDDIEDIDGGEIRELARIALASLEAEPVAYMHRSGQVVTREECCDDKTFAICCKVETPIYTAPPAPVSVKIPPEKPHTDGPLADGWNACRAAMLQGADGALSNEDTKRVDELVMWIKRLAHSLRKSNPDSKLQSDAMDYLSRKGLVGVKDILR
nr:hypothetical protein EATA8330_12140 [Enterobacter asburiae]